MEKCKFCQEELEEGVTLCPACGKDNQEEPAAEVGETVVLSGEETVPAEATPEQTAEVAPEETEAKPGKKQLWIAEGAEHAASYLKHRAEYVKRVKEFLSCTE